MIAVKSITQGRIEHYQSIMLASKRVLIKAVCSVWTKLVIQLQIRALIRIKKRIMIFLFKKCSVVFKNGIKIGFTITPSTAGFSLTAKTV